MMRFTWAVFRNSKISSFCRSFSCGAQNLPVIKVINDKHDECIKLSFRMNNSQNLNVRAPKSEELHSLLKKLKQVASLQRKKEEIRNSIISKYTGTTQLALKAEEDIDVCLFQNDKEIDDNITNAEAWSYGSSLKIGDMIYDVKYNYPTVLSLTLPEYIIAGCVIRPHVLLESANLCDCDFLWYSSMTDNDVEECKHIMNSGSVMFEDDHYWRRVGQGSNYLTTDEDIGHHLKVVCIPKSGDRCGDKFSANSQTEVQNASHLFPFEERHAFTKEFADEQSIRCLSYNILANVYVEKRKFPYCSKKGKDIYYRKQLLIKEILGFNSDVICLQEVQERIFDLDLKPIFNAAGYEGFYMKKGGRRSEGLATFFLRKKFRIVNNHGILLNAMVKEREIFIDLLEKVSGNFKGMGKLLIQDTAYQALLLEDNSPEKRKVLVANTHLYSNKDTPEVRLIQAALCAYYTEHILKSQGNNLTGILFCGDFNSLPNSTAYKFLTSGNFECCPSWKNSKTDSIEPDIDTTLRHNLQLASACGTPEYTNYTQEFNGCLDYIFYNTDCLCVTDVVPMPSHEKVTEQVALPSEFFPSDHLPLVCTLKWRNS